VIVVALRTTQSVFYHWKSPSLHTVYLCVPYGSYTKRVVGIATRYGLDGPGIDSGWRARFSAAVQASTGAHPASYTVGTGSLSRGVNRPGRGFDHPPSSSARVKERVELYFYSLSGPSWFVLGWTYHYIIHCTALSDVFKMKTLFIERLLWILNSSCKHSEPGYNDIGLYDISSISSDILWYRLISHC
jgi:hypothetical protein